MDLPNFTKQLDDLGLCTNPKAIREWGELAEPWMAKQLVANTDGFVGVLRQAKRTLIEDGKMPYYPKDFAAHLKEMRYTEEHMREAELPQRKVGHYNDPKWPYSWAESEEHRLYLQDVLGMHPVAYLAEHGPGSLTVRGDLPSNPDELRAMRNDTYDDLLPPF